MVDIISRKNWRYLELKNLLKHKLEFEGTWRVKKNIIFIKKDGKSKEKKIGRI
jgi:hypothetical protein